MAKIEFELKDANGIDAEIGDVIEVTFPELSFDNGEYCEVYYRPRFTVTARILCPPSRGLMLRVLSIVDDGGCPESIYKPGQLLHFRRTVWNWRKDVGK